MATITETISAIEVELEATERRHDRALAEAKLILNTATQEGRSNLTAEEEEQVQALRETRDQAKKDIRGIKKKLDEAEQVRTEELENEKALAERKSTGASRPAYDRVARVGSEERTYRKDSDPFGKQFLLDIARQFSFQDVESAHRLSRHMAEERVERAEYMQRTAVGTAGFTGLTVPQYLTDMYAPATANLRPFADVCNRHPLPESGMSVNISRITTPASAGLQASENTAVTDSTIDDSS